MLRVSWLVEFWENPTDKLQAGYQKFQLAIIDFNSGANVAPRNLGKLLMQQSKITIPANLMDQNR